MRIDKYIPQELDAEADIAEAQAREAAPSGPSMPHDEFMAELEKEDRTAS